MAMKRMLLVVIAIALAGAPLVAHHSFAAEFDARRPSASPAP